VVSFANHATGMKAYGEAGYAQGVHFEGVVSFNNGVASLTAGPLDKMENLFVGTTDNPADRISLVGNLLYHQSKVLASNLTLGYQHPANGSLVVQDNFIMGGSMALLVKHWAQATVTGNTVYAETSSNLKSDQSLVQAKQPAGSHWVWDRNRYFDGTVQQYPFAFNTALNQYGGGNLSWPEWATASRFDGSGHYAMSRPQPTVVVRPNRYEPGRAHVVVYNWQHAADVAVNLSGAGLNVGDVFEVRDAQNFFGAPLIKTTYTGAPVRMPLQNLNAGPAAGTLLFAPDHTAPEFAVFVVMKAGGATSPPPTEPQPSLPTPTITPAGGTFSAPVAATIASSTSGVTIRYTLDGSTPHAGSLAYTGPVQIGSSALLKARSFKTGSADSPVAQASFVINAPPAKAATPAFSPAPGQFSSAVKVTITSATPGATIHYTLNGAEPTTGSPVYSQPLPVSSTTTVRAFAVKPGMTPSAPAGGTYTIKTVTGPTTPTQIKVVSPLEIATGIVMMRVAISGTPVIAGVKYLINGQPAGPEVTAAPFEMSWDSRKWRNGRYQITAVARDSSGKLTTSRHVMILVKN
jgi:hypothetical protein